MSPLTQRRIRTGRSPSRHSHSDETTSQTTSTKHAINNMKQIQILLKASTAIALLALVVSCASTQTAVENKESMLVAAGFKVITPKTPAHQQKLQQLPPGKIAMIQKSGKTFYVYPDAAHNQAYVGGPQEYQAYQQARLANKLAEENLETAEMYQDANMNWGAWGGWGMGWGGMGVGRWR
jgi:hypothetical protein